MKALRPMKKFVTLSFVAVGVVLCAACGGTADEQKGTLTISFPSTAAAVASDTLELHVIDGSSSDACLNAVQTLRKNQPVSGSLYDIPATDTCKFLSTEVKPAEISYGARAFVVIAQKSGANFLIGCTRTGIGDVGGQAVNVDLTPISTTTDVPQSTKCTTLSQKCGGTACF